MRENFAASLAAVLQSEGGYVNDPADKGGPTNKGVTQAVYDDWRASQGLPQQSVRNLSALEASLVYAKLYWAPCRCDDLPSGVDYATFDFAVNSGANRACRFLQRAVGAVQDGDVGPATLAAVASIPAAKIIDTLCDERAAFLKTCAAFSRFGKGWTARVAEVRAKAKEMAA